MTTVEQNTDQTMPTDPGQSFGSMAEQIQSAPASPEDHIAFIADLLGEERNANGELSADRDMWKYRATHDQLTGVLNRTGLELIGTDFEARAQTYGQPFAVVMADLDKFKVVNDTFGHQAGDAILKATADGLRRTLRVQDTGHKDFMAVIEKDESDKYPDQAAGENNHVVRTGGDEFIIIADLTPHRETTLTDEERAEAIVARCRELAEQLKAAHPEYVEKGFDISFGVSVWQPGMTLEELISKADVNMYSTKAKHHAVSGTITA